MNFIFSKGFIQPKVTTGFATAYIVYINNKFFARVRSKIYKIAPKSLSSFTVLYSLPENDAYDEWTSKHVGELSSVIENKNKFYNEETVSKYWAGYKPGLKLRGVIDDNEIFNPI